ncbi:TetR/AcrR family transcriptional regulator [Streptomyces sp. NPDC087420]|uniref:TetR/AcrR family transcriptional regulator n=1 Tax=Streptomyces sp. NPDC087420 TaxID=3365785 RepID=UPI003832C40C
MAAGARRSRRAEYAEATRQAIVDAARELFRARGYFATKVDEIAVGARVSPATVYAVAGGKQGLLSTLVGIWSAAPIVAESRELIVGLTDPEEIMREPAAMTRAMRQDYGDIMRVVLDTAPHDATAAEGLATATARYRAGLGAVASHLAGLGALREDVGAGAALDVLWFYFGYAGFFTLVDDNGWSYPQAEAWLLTAATQALLRPAAA